MEVLSEVLRAVRLNGALYFDLRLASPWVAETPGISVISEGVMPDAEYVIAFHVVLEGELWAQLGDESEPPVWVEAGDAIMFPQGDGHVMGSEQRRRGKPYLELYRRPSDRGLPLVLKGIGGNGDTARVVCGYIGCDARPFNPILGALPRMMHLKSLPQTGSAAWSLLTLALSESQTSRAGGEALLAKLSELIFVQTIQDYVERLDDAERSWFAALRDRQVSRALACIHGRPDESWTVEHLASEAGMSRAAFYDRFTGYTGMAPMQYLTRWRMHLAARALQQAGMTVANVANDVGYQSEPAFIRAFKKTLGVTPSQWRQGKVSIGR